MNVWFLHAGVWVGVLVWVFSYVVCDCHVCQCALILYQTNLICKFMLLYFIFWMDLFITINFQSINKIWKYRPDGVQYNCIKSCLDQLMQPIKSVIAIKSNWWLNLKEKEIWYEQSSTVSFTFSTFFVRLQVLIDCLWTNRSAFLLYNDMNIPPSPHSVC